MESPKSYAAKLLQSKQGGHRKLMVFACLALAVVILTAAVLALHAQAMNYTRRVLECAYETHVHTLEECGAPDALTCGLADYVVHVHNDDCYDADGALVCPLREERPHTHDASCFVEYKELVCEEEGITEEEAAALTASYVPDHEHTEECFIPGEQTLSCGREEEEAHVHTEECYSPGERVLDCGQEETEGHAHSEACYAPGERVLGCGQEETEGHVHSEACYTPGEPVLTCEDTSEEHVHEDGCYTPGEPVLSCGQEEQESHTHTDDCYIESEPVLTCGQDEHEAHAHTDDCYTEGEPVLTCGQDEHDAHTHTEDCYTEGEPVLACDQGEEILALVPEHVHNEECYQTVSELVCGKLELHTHTDACYLIIKPEDPEYEPYRQAGFENEEIRLLICEIPQLEEHVHGEECFTEVELSPDEVAALKAQEMGIELRDLQAVYEDADVRVTVNFDTLSLVPESASVALLNANTPVPEPTPNPLLLVETQPEAAPAAEPEAAPEAAPAAEPEAAPEAEPEAAPEAEPEVAPEAEPEAAPADEEPAAAPAAEPEVAPAPEAQPAASENEAPAAVSAAVSSEAPEVVRAGLMAEGREWLPAATVTYTVQYLDNGIPIGEAVQYVYTPGGALPSFPRSIARYYRECRTDAFVVTARYNEFARIPEEAELRVSIISDEEQVAAYESAYKEALNTSKAQMLSLLDIGFWMDDAEVQPAAPVSITVQLLGEDGLPAGEPLAIVHFGEQTEVLAATADEAGIAAFNMNGFSPVGIGQVPESDEEGRVLLSGKTFEWIDPQGLYQVTFEVNGVISPVEEDAEPSSEEEAAAGEAEAGEDVAEEPQEDTIPLATDSLIDFMVEIADDSNALYETYAQEVEEGSVPLMHLSVLEYQINYSGMEMDLSDCKVTITVTPTMLLQAEAAEFAENAEVDNGDDDNDGYVESANGESRLPAPMLQQGALLSVSIPQQNEEVSISEDAEEVTFAKQMILLDGSDAVADAPLDVEMLAMAPAMDTLAISMEEFGSVMTYASTQSVSVETMANGSSGVAVLAVHGEPDPNYVVQYYANITRPADEGTNALTLIDTTGKKLPTNKGNINTEPTGQSKYLYVDNSGKVETVTELTEVYTSGFYKYFKKPSISYVEKLVENPNYELKEIWVLKEGKKTESTNRDDWDIYTFNSNLYFTNLDYENVKTEIFGPAIQAGKKFIYIKEGTVLRFVYDQTNKDNDFAAAFYDYDISTGRVHRALPPTDPNQYVYKTAGQTFSGDSLTSEVLNWAAGLSSWDGHLYAYTKEQGINSSGNYSGSGTKLAFGNVNAGTGLGKLTWLKDGVSNELNKYNNKGYQGCTFGLVTGMSNGKIQYASNVNAPKLFNEGSATGKTSYDNGQYSLKFARVGDTYTLSAVNGTGATNLGNFSNPTNSTGTHTNIWTNNFWPMDSADSFGTGTHDVKFGGTATFKGGTHEIRFGPITQKGTDYTFPESDDGLYHNSYFGMHFEVEFKLDKDYIGPLEYWFFGDDDMWVFLDGKLVCDIGGVHSSVGEYVDLWDYLHKHDADCYSIDGETGEKTLTCENTDSETPHKLSFFYTERGASGSTCWMQFTLPSVSSLTPETSTEEYGQLQIDKRLIKKVNGTPAGTVDNGEKFQFVIEIKDANGNTDYNGYRCARYKTKDLEAELQKPAGSRDLESKALEANLLAFSSAEFTLGADESIYIEYLPMGTSYTITERDQVVVDGVVTDSKYVYSTTTKVDNDKENESKEATGTITQGHKSTAVFTNTYTVFNLPKTGSVPAEAYVVGGGALILAAAFAVRKRRKKAKV